MDEDMAPPSPRLCGVVLAAGGGRRRGAPKALAVGESGVPWLGDAVRLLLEGGCDEVVVVLGAEAARARAHVPAAGPVRVVVASEWARGLAESLRAGLDAATGVAAVITLVDLPGTPVAVVERLLTRPVDASTLRRATYRGRPGHPVVVGRDHWEPLTATLTGDRGAHAYLTSHGADRVECGDLHHGEDDDGPPS